MSKSLLFLPSLRRSQVVARWAIILGFLAFVGGFFLLLGLASIP